MRRTAFQAAVVGDEADTLLHFETRVPRLLQTQAPCAFFKDGRLDVGYRRGHCRGGQAVWCTNSVSNVRCRLASGFPSYLAITSMCAMTVLRVSRTSQYEAAGIQSSQEGLTNPLEQKVSRSPAIVMTSLTSVLCFLSYSFLSTIFSSLSALSVLVVKYMPFV